MMLYIIYIEPLINVWLLSQKDEDYCDDINCVGENVEDLVIIDGVFLMVQFCRSLTNPGYRYCNLEGKSLLAT